MIKTSRILSFTGGALTLGFGVLSFILYPGTLTDTYYNDADWFLPAMGIVLIVCGICALIAGFIVARNPRLSRILLLIAAVSTALSLVFLVLFLFARKYAFPDPDGEASS